MGARSLVAFAHYVAEFVPKEVVPTTPTTHPHTSIQGRQTYLALANRKKQKVIGMYKDITRNNKCVWSDLRGCARKFTGTLAVLVLSWQLNGMLANISFSWES